MKKITNLSKSLIGGCYSKKNLSALNKSKAFTLIELLVVIAIIGILAGVVIASLNSARTSGRVAAIKSNLKNLQTQAIMYHADNGTFAGLCTWVAPSTIQSGYHSSVEPMIEALKNIAGAENVRCVVRTSNVPSTSATHFVAADGLQDKNFGVAVYYNNMHYGVDITGLITLDDIDSNGGATTNWTNANNICTTVGKRLPSVEILKAVADTGATGGNLGFISGQYWSITNSDIDPSYSYYLQFSLGNVGRVSKISNMRVRCAS